MRGYIALISVAVLLSTADLLAQDTFDYGSTTRITGTTDLADHGIALDIRGDLACLATATDLVCLDVTDPHAPHTLGQTAHGLSVRDVVWLDADHVAVIGAMGWVRIFLVADPGNPTAVGSVDLGVSIETATLAGDILALVGAVGLHCVDVSDPTTPVAAGSGLLDHEFEGIAVLPSGHVLLTQVESVLEVDLSDPAAPIVVGSLAPRYLPHWVVYHDVVTVGHRAFLTADQAMPVASRDQNRQQPYIVFMVDLLDPSGDGLIAYWQTDWDSNLRLHAAVGDLVYGSIDEQMVIFDATRTPPNVHALEPDLVLDVGDVINDIAGGNTSIGLAVAAPTLATLPAGEARGVPAAARFARGQYGSFVSPRWAWSHTVGDLYVFPNYKYYLWDLADPLQPTVRDSIDCCHGFEFNHSSRAIAARDAVVIRRDTYSSYSSLVVADYGQDPPQTTALNERRNALFFGDLLVTYDDSGWPNPCLDVVDLADPGNPVQLATLAIEDLRTLRRLNDTRGLVEGRPIGQRWLQRLDLDDPEHPTLTGWATLDATVSCLGVLGDLALVGTWNGGLHVLDHTTMTWRGSLTVTDSGMLVDIAVTDQEIWACWSYAGLALVDLTDPDAPTLASEILPLPGAPSDIQPTAAGAAYVACDRAGVQFVTANAANELELIGGGGVHANGVGMNGNWVRTFSAILPPASHITTAAPASPAVGAASLRAVPNPFNPRTVISFSIQEPGPVDMAVYDLRGRLVRTLRRDVATAGDVAVTWDGCDDRGREVAAGVYLVQLWTTMGTSSGRVSLVR